MSEMTALVAGIGYIGSKVAEDLLLAGERVVGVDNFFATERRVVADLATKGDFDFVEGSVTSRRTFEKALRGRDVDTVYWLAAQASAHPEAASPRYTERTNLLAPRLILEAAREFGLRTVVVASSLKVYGPYLHDPVDESSPYGVFTDLAHLSQCYVEKLAEMYAALGGLRCVAVRLGVVYGLGPVVKRDYRFMTAPNKFCLQAARGEELVVTASGARPMGFIHVADAAQAMLLAGNCEDFDGFTAVNAATEIASPLHIAGMVRDAAATLGREVRVKAPDVPMARRPVIALSSRLDALGFRGSRRLAPTIREMLGYFATYG